VRGRGGPPRLCPAPLPPFAAPGHGGGDVSALSGPAAAGPFRRGRGPAAGSGVLGRHGAGLPAGSALLPALAALGPGAAADRRGLSRLYPRFRLAVLAWPRWPLEGP